MQLTRRRHTSLIPVNYELMAYESFAAQFVMLHALTERGKS